MIPSARPDVALVDISLPGMSGLELAVRLRETYPNPAVLFVTGHDAETYRGSAEAAGAHGLVMKQDGPDALLEAIYDVLSRRRGGTAGEAPGRV